MKMVNDCNRTAQPLADGSDQLTHRAPWHRVGVGAGATAGQAVQDIAERLAFTAIMQVQDDMRTHKTTVVG